MLARTRERGEEREKSGMFLDSCLNKQMGVGVSSCDREHRNRFQGVDYECDYEQNQDNVQ